MRTTVRRHFKWYSTVIKVGQIRDWILRNHLKKYVCALKNIITQITNHMH